MMINKKLNIIEIVAGMFVATRFGAEAINTFFWDSANYVWSVGALATIGVVVWPILTVYAKGKRWIRPANLAILFYLLYMLVRTDLTQLYSLKCVLAELIVWVFFVFTVDILNCRQNAANRIRKLIFTLVKCNVIFGLLQMLYFMIANQTIDPRVIFENRPVNGIFVHPSIFLIMILPFIVPFMRMKMHGWALLLLMACLGTGTRSPFLCMILMSWVIFKYIARKTLCWKDMIGTILIIILTYSAIIISNTSPIRFEYEEADSRFTFGTLQWRIMFWQQFIDNTTGKEILIGHGVGQADQFAREGLNPHNDYIRIYFDMGLVGVFLYLCVMLSLWTRAVAVDSEGRDLIFIVLVLMAAFVVTDNFLYVSNRLLLLTFLGTFFTIREGSAMTEKPALALMGRKPAMQ
jgi:hypothetical protein